MVIKFIAYGSLGYFHPTGRVQAPKSNVADLCLN